MHYRVTLAVAALPLSGFLPNLVQWLLQNGTDRMDELLSMAPSTLAFGIEETERWGNSVGSTKTSGKNPFDGI